MKLILIFSLTFIMFFFQNCGQLESLESSESSGSTGTVIEDPVLNTTDCEEIYLNHFESSFYKKFREVGCNNCHNQSSLLSFADNDLIQAYSSFSERATSDFISKISVEKHQQTLLNYNTSELSGSLTFYDTELKEIKRTCSKLTDLAHTTSTKTVDFFDPAGGGPEDSRCSFNDPILLEYITTPFSQDNPKTSVVEWDLGAEDSRLEGVSVKIEISPEQPQGFPIGSPAYTCPNQDGYQVGNLRFMSTTNTVNLKNVSIFLNGSDQENLHYFGVDLKVRPEDGEVYMLGENGGFTIFTMVGQPVLKSDAWQIQIETIDSE